MTSIRKFFVIYINSKLHILVKARQQVKEQSMVRRRCGNKARHLCPRCQTPSIHLPLWCFWCHLIGLDERDQQRCHPPHFWAQVGCYLPLLVWLAIVPVFIALRAWCHLTWNPSMVQYIHFFPTVCEVHVKGSHSLFPWCHSSFWECGHCWWLQF